MPHSSNLKIVFLSYHYLSNFILFNTNYLRIKFLYIWSKITTLKQCFLIPFLLFFGILHSQINEDFTDGNFNLNPIWEGTSSDFVVNSSSQLQVNNTLGDTSYLSSQHGLSTLDDKEWRFWVKQTFSPSALNYGRVFLSADNTDLTLVQNGYYLQFGEALTVDAIRLFKIVNGISTQICAGADGQIAASFNVAVKVVRSSVGLWSIYADFTGGANFSQIASGTDNSNSIGSYFGMLCVYTLSNANKFYYDNIYVGDEIVDTNPPILISATAISALQIDVLFNEAITSLSGENINNYDILPFQSASSATLDLNNPALVHITPLSPLQNGTSYTLLASSISDLVGNIATNNQSAQFQYLVADTVVKGDVIITEFFPDPSPIIGLPEVEYVEIYNKSTKVFNIEGWKICDASSEGNMLASWLLPGEYKIVTASANIPLFTSLTCGVTSFPSLNNASDDLILKDNFGLVLDQLSYTDDWYQDEIKKEGGYSLELINPNDPCSDQDNWIASNAALGGTPGIINSVYNAAVDTEGPTIDLVLASAPNLLEFHFSEGMDSLSLVLCTLSFDPSLTIQNRDIQGEHPTMMTVQFNETITPSQLYNYSINPIADCWLNSIGWNGAFILPATPEKGELIINEILQNPLNGGQDWIELYNNSDKVFNLKDWQFANFDNDTISNFKTISGNYLLMPADYVVVGKDSSFVKENYLFAVPGKFIYSELPSYNNDSGTVYIIYNSEIIDQVSYLDTWHFDLLDNTNGVSLERIDPKGLSSSSYNWHSASESIGFASPGRKNSQYFPAVSNGDFSLSSEILSPDNDGYQDIVQFNYQMSEAGMLGKVTIYDDRGRLIRTICSNELLGTEGTLSWDGLTDKSSKASIGVYVILFEAFSTNGGLFFTQRKAITVAGML